MDDISEWQKIGNRLAYYFGTCSCQRKLKTIVESLVILHGKLVAKEVGQTVDFTGAELLLISIIDRWDNISNPISHGSNLEHPILMKEHIFWKWLMKVKDNPALVDN